MLVRTALRSLYFAKTNNFRAFCSSLLEYTPKQRAPGHTTHGFVNLKRVVAEAGNGGDGCIAFERLFCNPKGGPSGGDGGNGGHVVFQASSQVSDLSNIPSIVRAQHGANGSSSNLHGANASHTYLQVPIGTCIYDLESANEDTSSGTVLKPIGRLMHDEAIFIAARGGAGGKGNAFLTTTAILAKHQSHTGRNNPLRIAERGGRGQHRRLILRMSQLAELGLVGMPNAGKSTLLRRLTRARPKVAPYPFTTLKPHMGILKWGRNSSTEDFEFFDENQITIADLPGLIPGAAEHNRGLGTHFLSLIADCQLLAYVVDIGTPWVAEQSQDELITEIGEQLSTLRHELFSFDSDLPDPKRSLIIATKLDLIRDLNPDLSVDSLTGWITEAAVESGVLDINGSDRVIPVSARRGDNMDQLLECIQKFGQTKRDTVQ